MQYKYLIYYQSAKRLSTLYISMLLSMSILATVYFGTVYLIKPLTTQHITHTVSHTHTHMMELAKACNANYSNLKFRKSCASVYSAGNGIIRMFCLYEASTKKSLNRNLYRMKKKWCSWMVVKREKEKEGDGFRYFAKTLPQNQIRYNHMVKSNKIECRFLQLHLIWFNFIIYLNW